MSHFSLWKLIPKDVKRIAIVGLAKNVGKTTLLNELIAEGASRSLTTLGLASIGVDGEAIDVWDQQPKPAITIQEGMWAATAKAALAESTASFRYVEELKSSSPLGSVYLVQCTKSGSIKLAGTHLLADLEQVQQAMSQQKVTHTLIDGAYDRIATAQNKVAEAFFLCTGAALETDLHQAKLKTEEALSIWRLPLWTGDVPGRFDRVAFLQDSNWNEASTAHAMQMFEQLRFTVAEGIEALWLPGALTEHMLEQLLVARHPFPILLDNPTKCFVRQGTILRWFRKGGGIYVRQKSKLLALAVNPSSTSYNGRAREWLLEMKRIAGELPVIDVKSQVYL